MKVPFFCYPLSKMGLFISRSRKNTIILRTALSVRVHNCIGEWNFNSNILSHLPFHSLSCRSPCLSENSDLSGTHDQREGERVIYNLNSVQLKAVWSARIFLAHRQIPCQLFWKPDICCVLSHVWLIWTLWLSISSGLFWLKYDNNTLALQDVMLLMVACLPFV